MLSLVQTSLDERQQDYDEIIREGNEDRDQQLILLEDIETLKTTVQLLKDAIKRKHQTYQKK
jgi:hypothetical protein